MLKYSVKNALQSYLDPLDRRWGIYSMDLECGEDDGDDGGDEACAALTFLLHHRDPTPKVDPASQVLHL